MNMKLTQFSIVVVAADHNPTILNPDFLKIQKIVPGDWALAGPAITTPPFATVPYENGVTVSVEPGKLQVADNKSSDPIQSRIVSIVDSYVKTVPHVKYTAVGINFNAIIAQENADRFLIDRFLQNGSWNTSDNSPDSLGLKFAYPVESGRFILSLESGRVNKGNGKEKQEQAVLLMNANFHRDLMGSHEPLNEQVSNCLGFVGADWVQFNKTVENLLSE